MIETKYYSISVRPSLTYDDEIAMLRAGAYNDAEQNLNFVCRTEDGTLHFLLLTRHKPGNHNFFDILHDMTDIFDADNVNIDSLKTGDMTMEQLRRVNVMKRVMLHRFGEDMRCRWNSKSADEVMNEVDGLVGFQGFKAGMHHMRSYCETLSRKGCHGSYNVVLVNDDVVDTELFADLYFDLLSAQGVILDNCICEGDMEDALSSSRNTPLLYILSEVWDSGMQTNMLRATTRQEAFLRLAKRNCVYITSMDRRQYEKQCCIDSFMAAFPHVIMLGGLSQEDKVMLLVREADRLGFSANPAEFWGYDLSGVSMAGILSAVSVAVGEKLRRPDSINFTLQPKDMKLTPHPEGELDPLAVLYGLIGLDEVKQKICEIRDFINRRGKDALPCLHMVFRGNPGTGKTTVARLVGKILADCGALRRRDTFIETDREDLVALYVGHTAVKTAQKVKEAMGGVLFIDEAYSLGLYERGTDYGEEALSTLVKRMEDYRRDFVCIMAGYTDEMNKMLDVNPGLRDRIQFYIDFPDYTAEELMRIFVKFSDEKGYRLSMMAQAKLRMVFDAIVSQKGKNFSNARLARKLFERVIVQQGLRTGDMEIMPYDIDKAFASPDIAVLLCGENKKRMGF